VKEAGTNGWSTKDTASKLKGEMKITKKQENKDDDGSGDNINNNNMTVCRNAYTTKPQPLSEIRTEKGTVTIWLTYCHFPFFFDVLSTLYYTEST
jgi:hypothetical protein